MDQSSGQSGCGGVGECAGEGTGVVQFEGEGGVADDEREDRGDEVDADEDDSAGILSVIHFGECACLLLHQRNAGAGVQRPRVREQLNAFLQVLLPLQPHLLRLRYRPQQVQLPQPLQQVHHPQDQGQECPSALPALLRGADDSGDGQQAFGLAGGGDAVGQSGRVGGDGQQGHFALLVLLLPSLHRHLLFHHVHHQLHSYEEAGGQEALAPARVRAGLEQMIDVYYQSPDKLFNAEKGGLQPIVQSLGELMQIFQSATSSKAIYSFYFYAGVSAFHQKQDIKSYLGKGLDIVVYFEEISQNTLFSHRQAYPPLNSEPSHKPFPNNSNSPILNHFRLLRFIYNISRIPTMLETITNWQLDTTATEEEYKFETQLAREKGWCSNYTRQVVEEYKKFLYLCQVSDFGCVPSKAIDQAWHMHILRTTNYSKMCKDVFGKFLHHAPTASLQDQKLLEEQFERTLQAYEKTFGTTAPSQAWKEKGNGICCSEI